MIKYVLKAEEKHFESKVLIRIFPTEEAVMKHVDRPAELLIAILHRVGDGVIIEDRRLTELFTQAAEEWPLVMGYFADQPPYGHSPELSRLLQDFALSADIVRLSDPVKGFVISQKIRGGYGANIYLSFPEQTRSIIEQLVVRIQALTEYPNQTDLPPAFQEHLLADV